jgi:hypothetical protein
LPKHLSIINLTIDWSYFCNAEDGQKDKLKCISYVTNQRNQSLLKLPSHVQEQGDSAEFSGVNEHFPDSDWAK